MHPGIMGGQTLPAAQAAKVAVEHAGRIAACSKCVPRLDQRVHLFVAPQLQEVQPRVLQQFVLRDEEFGRVSPAACMTLLGGSLGRSSEKLQPRSMVGPGRRDDMGLCSAPVEIIYHTRHSRKVAASMWIPQVSHTSE